jgi:hypothetical protein
MSTDTTTTNKIKPEVQAVSDYTHKHLKMAKDGATTGQDDLYPEHVKRSGKTMEEVNAVHEMDAIFVAGTVDGIARHTEHTYAKHPAVNDIAVTVPMALNGRNRLVVGTERQHTYPTPGREGVPAGSVTKHNEITVKYHTVEANFSAGQLKEVKAERGRSAREALGGVKA